MPGACRPTPTDGRRAASSGRSPTCRPSRPRASRSTRARTFSRSASCSTRWPPASARSRVTPASRSSPPSCKDTPKAITQVRPDLPRDLGRIIRHALAKDPEHRYQTAKDLRNDLEALGTSLQSGELPGAMESAPVVGARSARALPWLLAASASVGLLWLALVHFRERPASSPLVKSLIVPPIQLLPSSAFSLSPDGQFLAFIGAGQMAS